MPPVELRPFQAELERRVYEAWNAGALNVMPVAATGSGDSCQRRFIVIQWTT